MRSEFSPNSALSTQHSSLSRVSLIIAATLLAGCGYQFRVEGQGPTIGGAPTTAVKADAPTMAILNFENRSTEPNLETKYAAYTRREFAGGSGTLVVNGSGPTDLVLKGKIISVVIPTIAFTLQQTLESRVTVYVTAIVENMRTHKTIWAQTVTASSEFFVTKDLQFNRVLQTRALEQAGQYIAQDLANRFLNHLEYYGTAPAPPGTGTGVTVPGVDRGGFSK